MLVGPVAFLTACLGMAPAAGAAPPRSRPDEAVIIVLKNQYRRLPEVAALATMRTRVVNEAQRSVITSLAGSGAVHLRRLHLLDAVAATVSPAEEARLVANPTVAEVVPDAVFRGPTPVVAPAAGADRPQAASSLAPGTCPAAGKVQLDPQGVEAVRAVSDDPAVRTARSLGYTGAGVTVGDIAVGVDPSTTELVRRNGTHVIRSYVDFTGEGTAEPGFDDIESYLDDSVMAAQGRLVYDLHDHTSGMPVGCDIRLQGVAPGITIDAYKVYAANVFTTTSAFLEAIDYAVTVNHVNVLNEEGGSFPMPDTSQDLIKAANSAAMAAGTTITSPSYDAGLENTIWSPSSQPGVLSVGASTVFRSYAQGDAGEYTNLKARGWVNDNISSLSSGGSTEQGRSLDVVAPGDSDWIACPTETCGTDLILTGGTSESGPIVAAVAALVIQAYRSTHGGGTPTVALVRNIITSTADDLDSPGAQQGAGLVDAYRAVEAAMAVPAHRSVSARRGAGLVANAQQLDAIGPVGAAAKRTFVLTNEGARPAHVVLGARTLGPVAVIVRRVLHFTDTTEDRIFTVRLAHGVSRLAADLAYPGAGGGSQLAISLADPHHRLSAYSLPQGDGDHGHVDVHGAGAGRWTIDVSNQGEPYRGPVAVEITTAMMVPFATVSPSRVTIGPGRSTKVTLDARLPTRAGDRSASVTWTARGLGHSSMPVTLRSLVPIVGGVGHFATTLVGGNGRGFVPAQTFFYNVDVGRGRPDLDVQTRLGGNSHDAYYAYLIAPNGDAVAQATNRLLVRISDGASVVKPGPGARLHTLSPTPGRWTLIITFTNPVAGNALTTPLSGTIDFAPVAVRATGLPDKPGSVLVPGRSRVVKVTVSNDGDTPESYFLDARLDRDATVALTSITPSQDLALPLPYFDQYPQWIVPTDTKEVTATARSSAPTTFDVGPANGEPDVGATVHGDAASATLHSGSLTQGDWILTPQPVGPFGPGGAAPSTTSLGLVATTRAFDRSIATSTGDLWEPGPVQRADFRPVVVQPGQTATLYAVITPTAAPGTVVSGTLYLDDATALSNEGSSPSGDQLARLPYVYRVRTP